MLVNIFGAWVNPNNISRLYESVWNASGKNGTCIAFNTITSTSVDGVYEQRTFIEGKKSNEVADEINRQIAEAKPDLETRIRRLEVHSHPPVEFYEDEEGYLKLKGD